MGSAAVTIIHGVHYPSQAAAAKAIGCHHSAIWWALEHGREVTICTGKHVGKWRPCNINGSQFQSQAAAAKTLGVSRSSICQAVKEGRDRVGSERNRKHV